MDSTPRNAIEFRVWGRFAMFTDPLTRVGGEKCSYHVPTYEALKGIAKSIYWKPTFIWIIDTVRVMRRIRTQTKGAKPLNFGGVYPSERNPTKKKEESYNTLAIYTFLTGDPDPNTGLPSVEYQVRAHFEWNDHQPELKRDQVEGKHYAIARRSLERGGRQDIFLGTRDCQGYVEPCVFGSGQGDYDSKGELGFGLMFHSFGYPDETGVNKLQSNFWFPKMMNGVMEFPRPEQCRVKKEVREMLPKQFGIDHNLRNVTTEAEELGF
ncbi:MAG TPA: type I-C CRISPR-associated protein Cas5c [Candidatus Angelobacter sp.]|nr:type I-C CRISPR-associated protein Cas5c [Candidatus Angelobacter sp.]